MEAVRGARSSGLPKRLQPADRQSDDGRGTDSYVDAQLRQLELYRAHWNEAVAPRIALGRVIVPTDGANARERERYRAFAEGRHARTLAPQGERRTLFAPDLVGTSDEIVERLLADPVVGQVHELRLELPYDLPFENYRQILEDFITRIAPHSAGSRLAGERPLRPEVLDMTFHRMPPVIEAGEAPEAAGHVVRARRVRIPRDARRAGGDAPSTSLQLDRT